MDFKPNFIKLDYNIINVNSIINIEIYEKDNMVEPYYLEITLTDKNIVKTFKYRMQRDSVMKKLYDYIKNNGCLLELQ
jgi:hypothetical protein